MRAIVCQSDAEETSVVAAELLAKATAQLGGERPVAALLFASAAYDHDLLLAGLVDRWPGLPLVGGTSDGEVGSAGGFRHDSAVLALLMGEGFEAHVGVGRDLSHDVEAAVSAATAGLATDSRVCFTVFAPSTNGSEVVASLQRRLPGCPIAGGLTGHHAAEGRMREFFGREATRDSVVVLALTGAVGVGLGIGSGWFPIGEATPVTSSAGHVVYTIGGRPAVETFRDYWGAVPEEGGLGQYPLAVYPDGLEGAHFLRAVLRADAATGSLHCAGAVPEGALVRMTEVLPEGILSGSAASARNALADYAGSSPELALVFSCAARKWVLGTEAPEELGSLQRTFRAGGVDPALAGLYVFGEVAPGSPGAASDLHNETCVTVLVGK